MRTVAKGPAPDCVKQFLKSTPTANFEDLKKACKDEMDAAFLREQSGLCAFCCNRLVDPSLEGRSRIAHVSPRQLGTVSETEWQNLVLSCDSERLPDPSCDAKQGNRDLPVSPLTSNVESLFEYFASGRMVGRNQAAQDTVRILNLDSADPDDRNHRLRAARRLAIATMASLKASTTPAQWQKALTGNYRPLPAFQPAITFVLGRRS